MKFFSTLPRGLVVFLGALIIILFLILGYKLITSGSGTTTTSNGNSFFSSIFPFFGGSGPGAGSTTASTSPLLQSQSGAVTILREVTANPVSGAWFATNPLSTSSPLITYMDRQSGNIFATPADSLGENRISNTTDPGIEEVYAVSDSSAILRSFSSGSIQNFLGIINATSSEEDLISTPLPPFTRVSVERDNGTMLTVTQGNGSSEVELSKTDGTQPQIIYTSPIESWVPLLAGARTFIETAPTAVANGYLYEIVGGVLSKITGGFPGMTAIVSPSGRYVAYSGNTAAGFSLSVVDTKTGAVFKTPSAGFALACAWVPNQEPLLFCAVPVNPPSAAYPDDWLSGTVSFSDDAWIVNPTDATDYFIGTLTDKNGVGLDAENISVDSTGSYALFMNKNDLSLWSLWIQGTVARASGE